MMYLGYRAILFFALLFVALTAMNALAQPEPRVIIHLTSYILLLAILWVVGLRLYRWTRRTDVHRKQMRPWRVT